MQFILPIILSILSNLRTIPGAVSVASAATAGAVTVSGAGPLTTSDWVLMACGAVGVLAQFVQSQLTNRQPVQVQE